MSEADPRTERLKVPTEMIKDALGRILQERHAPSIEEITQKRYLFPNDIQSWAIFLRDGAIDTDGAIRFFQQVIGKGADYETIVEDLHRIERYIETVRVHAEVLPKYFPPEVLAEIRGAWGVIPKEAIVQKYVYDRIPREEQVMRGRAGMGGGN